MNDQQIEKEIVEKGKTAPRVTPDHIEGIIAQEAISQQKMVPLAKP